MARAGDEIARMVARPGGLVLTRDLIAAGLSEKEARLVVRRLYRIRRGAYALAEPTDIFEYHALLTRAVILNHDRYVVASHVSAAVMHGLPLFRVPLTTAHITGFEPVRRGIRHGVHLHEGPFDEETDFIDLVDIPVTSVPRTLIDCALVLPLDRAVVIADHALHRGLADADELDLRCRHLPPVTGIDRVPRVLALADGRSESPGEGRTRLIVVQAGIAVEPQVVVHDERRRFVARVDLKVRGYDVAIEFDGRSKYRMRGDIEQAHWDEKQRHDALNEAGFVVVRVTWDQLERPAEIVARVRRAMTRARGLAV